MLACVPVREMDEGVSVREWIDVCSFRQCDRKSDIVSDSVGSFFECKKLITLSGPSVKYIFFGVVSYKPA